MELVLLCIAGICCLLVCLLVDLKIGIVAEVVWGIMLFLYYKSRSRKNEIDRIYKQLLGAAKTCKNEVRVIIENDKLIAEREKVFKNAREEFRTVYYGIRKEHVEILENLLRYFDNLGHNVGIVEDAVKSSNGLAKALDELVETIAMSPKESESIASAIQFLTEAQDDIEEIHRVGRQIVDVEIQQRINEVIRLIEKMNGFVVKHSECSDDARRLYQHYIPLLSKILSNWLDIEKNVSGGSRDSVRNQVLQLLGETKEGFQNIYNDLYSGIVLDTETDISVAKKLINSNSSEDKLNF